MPGFNIPIFNACHDANAFNVESTFRGSDFVAETARKHRFVLDIMEPFGGPTNGILLFLEKCTRPSPEIDEVTIHNGQDEIYRPGKNKWGPIEFTFYEKLRGGPGGFVDQPTELINRWWAETMIDLRQSVHNPVTNYYKSGTLRMLDGVGNPVWTYLLYDCWPQKVSPSELNYADSDIATITVTLRFNKAEERPLR